MMSRPNLVALIVACAAFMQQIDSTIVATALPQMAISLHSSPIQLSISITAYVLSLAVFIPISGWMADRFGASIVFRLAIVVFTLGSVLCGLSSNLGELTAFRVLQGMGGAMMSPVGRLIVLRIAKKSEMIGAMAWLQVPTQLGPVLGPLIGGFITTYLSWHWVFFVNVPIGIIGIVLATLFVKGMPPGERRPLDWFGFAVSGISLSCLMYGLNQLSRADADATATLGVLGVGLVLGMISVWHAGRHPHPLLRLSLLRIPTFAINFWAGSLFRFGTDALPFLLPLLLQLIFGMSAFASGLLTLASALGSMAMRIMAKNVLRRFGFRDVLIVNGLISVLTILSCELFSPATPPLVIFLALLIGGLFRALQFFSFNTIAYADLTPEQMSGATSFAVMGSQLSNGIGIAIAAICLHLELAIRGATVLSRDDLQGAFFLMAAISFLSMPSCLALARDAGAKISLHGMRGKA